MTTKDVFKLTDVELQELVGDYNDLYQIRRILMKNGMIDQNGQIDEGKFSKEFSNIHDDLTEEQGKSISQSINSYLAQ